jgi:methyltransferase
MMLLGVFLAIVIAQRLLELRVAKRNERWALSRGAREYGSEHYPLIVALHIAWIVGIAVEGIARGSQASALWPLWLSLFTVAQIGRYWAMSSLGMYWNTRILIVPGGERVRRGPYRFLNHPNYVIVALELLSGPLIFGATFTAIATTLANAALLLAVRIPAEERALELYRQGL